MSALGILLSPNKCNFYLDYSFLQISLSLPTKILYHHSLKNIYVGLQSPNGTLKSDGHAKVRWSASKSAKVQWICWGSMRFSGQNKICKNAELNCNVCFERQEENWKRVKFVLKTIINFICLQYDNGRYVDIDIV